MDDSAAEAFKAKQKALWASGAFGEVATLTTQTAGHLVRFAGVAKGHKVLDVGTGTGVVAVTAARKGATVTGIDLTPELLVQGRPSAALAGVEVTWQEGDAERLPFADGSFDVVLSEFGHMFAPRQEVAAREMLRVLRAGGTLAFATWPPEQMSGRSFALGAKYLPPPEGIPPATRWGDPAVVREILGKGVRGLFFERGIMRWPVLSPAHYRVWAEQRLPPTVRLLEALQADPEKIAAWRRDFEALVSEYLVDNVLQMEYLLTRATKS